MQQGLDKIRKIADNCENLQSLMIMNSLGGDAVQDSDLYSLKGCQRITERRQK